MSRSNSGSGYFDEHWKKERAERGTDRSVTPPSRYFGTLGQDRDLRNETLPSRDAAFAIKRQTPEKNPVVSNKRKDGDVSDVTQSHGQTFTIVPHAFLVTGSNFETDNDNSRHMHTSTEHDRNHLNELAGKFDRMHIDPVKVPYLVEGIEQRGYDNHGLKVGDFGVVIYNGRMAGAPVMDAGPSVLGEGSIELHHLLGHDTGNGNNDGIDRGHTVAIGFPGSGREFKGPYTIDAIETYAAKVYDGWVGKYPDTVKQYRLPSSFKAKNGKD